MAASFSAFALQVLRAGLHHGSFCTFVENAACREHEAIPEANIVHQLKRKSVLSEIELQEIVRVSASQTTSPAACDFPDDRQHSKRRGPRLDHEKVRTPLTREILPKADVV